MFRNPATDGKIGVKLRINSSAADLDYHCCGIAQFGPMDVRDTGNRDGFILDIRDHIFEMFWK